MQRAGEARATRSALEIASIFGTCSPIVMCSEVATANEIANATTVAPVPSPSAGSISDAIAGSPRKPIPIEASVIPTWHAASDSSIVSICSSACSAPTRPPSPAPRSALAGAHERELGRDEDPVDQDEQNQQEEKQPSLPGPLKPAGRGREAEQPADCLSVLRGEVVHGGRRNGSSDGR